MNGGCGGCGAAREVPGVAPALSATLATDTVAVPVTPCRCGRVPWLWLLGALALGYVLRGQR